ncbi:MAG TPA: hypothetical protein VHS31_02040 [Tepidisphaeraceae bacterium]|jgi:hypothetical protein|nr:hypothetical protein [Tepidisphaeraceae bacterium]
MKTNQLLVIVIALQSVMLAGQWLEGPRMLPAAQAEPFNAGADRQVMVDQLKSIDSKLDSMVTILNSGNLQVKVQQSDEHKDR